MHIPRYRINNIQQSIVLPPRPAAEHRSNIPVILDKTIVYVRLAWIAERHFNMCRESNSEQLFSESRWTYRQYFSPILASLIDLPTAVVQANIYTTMQYDSVSLRFQYHAVTPGTWVWRPGTGCTDKSHLSDAAAPYGWTSAHNLLPPLRFSLRHDDPPPPPAPPPPPPTVHSVTPVPLNTENAYRYPDIQTNAPTHCSIYLT